MQIRVRHSKCNIVKSHSKIRPPHYSDHILSSRGHRKDIRRVPLLHRPSAMLKVLDLSPASKVQYIKPHSKIRPPHYSDHVFSNRGQNDYLNFNEATPLLQPAVFRPNSGVDIEFVPYLKYWFVTRSNQKTYSERTALNYQIMTELIK